MTIKDVSDRINLSPQLIRLWIQNGTCPFGLIINKGVKNTYLINEEAFKRWMGGEIK